MILQQAAAVLYRCHVPTRKIFGRRQRRCPNAVEASTYTPIVTRRLPMEDAVCTIGGIVVAVLVNWDRGTRREMLGLTRSRKGTC